MRMADRSPEPDRNRLDCRHMRDPRRRKLVGLVKGPFARGLVRTTRRQVKQAVKHSRHDRLTRRQVSPGQQTALRIESCFEAGHRRRTIKVMRHVLLARPEGLHRRTVGGHRNLRSLADAVDIEPAPESASEILDLYVNLVGLQTGCFGHCAPGQIGYLRRDPGGRATIADLHRAIHGLKRCVSQIGRPVLGRQLSHRDRHRAVGITDRREGMAFATVERGGKPGKDIGARDPGSSAVIPGHLHLLERLHCPPRMIGNHCHAAGAAMTTGHFEHLFHAFQSGRLAGIKGLHFAAERRAHQHARVKHARANHIDSEAGATVRLDRPIEAVQGLADQREGRGVLQLDIGRNRPLRRSLRQFAEARLAARCMTELPARHGDLTGRHAPQVGRGTHQHRPRAGTRLTHRHPEVFHARRAAGHHHAELAHRLGSHPAGKALDVALIAGMKGQAIDQRSNVVVDRVDAGVAGAHL